MIKTSLQPVEYKVLVKQIEVEEKSEHGIILGTQSQLDKQQWAQTDAVLVAVGGNAFEEWLGEKPSVGDRVSIRQYTGFRVKDNITSTEFHVCNDRDISMIVKKQYEEIKHVS